MMSSIKVSMNGYVARQMIKDLSNAEIQAMNSGDARIRDEKLRAVEEEFANCPVLVGDEAIEWLLRYVDANDYTVNQDMIDLVESFPGNSQVADEMSKNIGATIAFW